MIKQKFHTRSFISFGLFVVIFWLLISGTVLYISPPGRVAHWQQWTFFGFGKDQWQAQHTIFSYVFIILAIFHIFSLNWKNLWSYVKLKSKAGLRKKREFVTAIILSIAVFIGTNLNVPPFSSFYDLGEEIGFSWEEKTQKAPMPHTENMSLADVCTKFLNIDPAKAMDKLISQGLIVNSESEKLKQIAEGNGTSPSQIYALLSPETRRSGKGYGRMTIKAVADDLGLDSIEIIQVLKANNIEASEDEVIKDIATNTGRHPSEIMKIIKGEH